MVFGGWPQDMKARTLPRMTALQMGQWRRLVAQSPHTTRWPQGMNTMDTSLSMQTLQVLSSCSCLSSSSGLCSFTVRGISTGSCKNDECVTTSYRCWPLTFSSGHMCSHSRSTGALPHLLLWRAQTRQSKQLQPKYEHHHKHSPLLVCDRNSDFLSKIVQQLNVDW